MSSEKINWRLHFIEFCIVTLGILIGFGLNSWNQTRKDKKQVELYLKGIKEELIENKKILEEVYPYHMELLEKLRKTPLEAQLTLSPGELTNSAWRLSENPIFKKHIDPAIYKTISAVYTTHDYLIEESNYAGKLISESSVLGIFYLSSTFRMELTEEEQQQLGIEFKQGWIPIFESWTSSEKTYLKRIDEALAVLD